jgi:hypothetical protein
MTCAAPQPPSDARVRSELRDVDCGDDAVDGDGVGDGVRDGDGGESRVDMLLINSR